MPARFFCDETDLALGRALEQIHVGEVVYPGHPDLPEVPRGTIDEGWLPVIGEQRLAVITRDGRIRRRPVEKRLWLDHAVRGFVLTGRGSQSTSDSVEVIEENWHRISLLLDQRPTGAWMFAVTAAGLREIIL